jgi:UDP-glucose 4-epimerase
MKETVLITGGAGFIGSHVAKHCLALGFGVVVLDDFSGGFHENIDVDCTVYEGSINDDAVVNHIFERYKFTYVYHLAAYAAEGLSHFIRKYNYMNNVVGSMNIINACVNHNVKCLVFTSSIAVMAGATPPYAESDATCIDDPYGNAKACVENDLKAAHKMFGLNYIIFRPFNVYGPGQNIGDKYRNVIGIFMNQIMNKQPLTIFGDGEQRRAFSYIDDVAPHIAKSVTIDRAYNETFYIGGAEDHSVNDLVRIIGKEFNVTPEVKYLAERKEAKNAWAHTMKAAWLFGNAKVGLSYGIAEMAEWAKRVGPRKSKEFGNIEITKNLPEGW